jgi:hypothetical protein
LLDAEAAEFPARSPGVAPRAQGKETARGDADSEVRGLTAALSAVTKLTQRPLSSQWGRSWSEQFRGALPVARAHTADTPRPERSASSWSAPSLS